MSAGNQERAESTLFGLFGRPYLDLEPFLEGRLVGLDLAVIDREITRGLAIARSEYTGGSLKWMGVVAPWAMEDGYRDYGHVIESMNEADVRELVLLGDDPDDVDLSRWRELRFGDETEHPLNLAQMRFLEFRYGVYFPWKVCVHLLENDKWEDKHSGAGKTFTADARRSFPETVRLVEALPFREIGRVVIFGLLANDHAPAHRDTEPGTSLTVAQSISIDPRGDKRFYLTDPAGRDKTRVDARFYWFNDMDYHGVDPAPAFQYSIRVDGTFERGFLPSVERALRR